MSDLPPIYTSPLPVQATLKVSGNGNLKLFSIPELVVPNSIEKYSIYPKHCYQNVWIG